MDDRLYPPPPPRLPAGYLGLPLAYRARVAGVLVAMALFAGAYLAMLSGVVFALRWVAVHVPPRELPLPLVLLWMGALVALGIALLVLLKGLLVRQARPRATWIEITAAREPVFFEFLARIAKEVRAPVPRRVFLTHDVNAAVFQDTTLLSLVWPPKKQLLVGMGLLTSLDLRELKAVLAHELGHFSQSSTRLGGYVYFGRQILEQLVAGRDSVDLFVDGLRRARRPEIAIVGGMAHGIVAGMRWVLGVLHGIVVRSDLALSRQMELQADRVAIAAAGSAAVVRSLARAAYGDACLEHALGELAHAQDHDLFTSDLYAHQLRAAETMPERAFRPEWLRLDATLGPSERPLFDPASDDARPSMWATHPSGAQREAHARAPWIEAPALEGDERSAWALFADPEGLRQRMTMMLARQAFPGRSLRFTDPETVERFLAEERASAALGGASERAYAGRPLALVPVDELHARVAAAPAAPAALKAEHEALYGAELERTLARREELTSDLEALWRAADQAAEAGRASFAHRGFERPLAEARALSQPLEAELEQLGEWLAAWDRRVAEVHVRMALVLDPALVTELRARYVLHAGVQELLRRALQTQRVLEPALAARHAPFSLGADDQAYAMRHALEARSMLAALIEEAGRLEAPPLPNLPMPEGLAAFLAPRGAVTDPALMGSTLAPGAIDLVARQHAEVIDRLDRVRKKSLAGLVASHEAIATRWRAAQGEGSVEAGGASRLAG